MGIATYRGRPWKNERDNLKRIWEWFFRPLVLEAENESTQLELVVEPKQNPITRWKTKKHVVLPGFWLETANCKLQGSGYRTLDKNHELFVRYEAGRNAWHVEHGLDQVFELTEDQWQEVKRHLEEIPDPCDHPRNQSEPGKGARTAFYGYRSLTKKSRSR